MVCGCGLVVVQSLTWCSRHSLSSSTSSSFISITFKFHERSSLDSSGLTLSSWISLMTILKFLALIKQEVHYIRNINSFLGVEMG